VGATAEDDYGFRGTDEDRTALRLAARSWEVALLNIEQEQTDDGYTVLRPVGELDAFTVSQFRQALAELASSPRLIIDMNGVPFVDSAGLGALIGGIRRARELGGDVVVVCSRPSLVRTLRTTGFDRIVTMAEGVEDAKEAFEKQGEGNATPGGTAPGGHQ
jgi:anti-sigma B factor antagonist